MAEVPVAPVAQVRAAATPRLPGKGEVGTSRARQRILLICAAVVMLFSTTDWLALDRFSGATLVIRLIWAALLVLASYAQVGADAQRTRMLLVGLAITSTLLYATLVQLTGGVSSAWFGWMLAVPMVVALVLQDYPAAIGGSGIVLVAAGLAILIAGGTTAAFAAHWAGEAVVMTWLALYVSATHRRMRAREEALRKANDEAAARVRVSEAAVTARDEFLAVASHELRTPLTSLLLHIEAIERGVYHNAAPGRLPTEKQRLDAVGRQARRLATLIDGMLDVSRLTTGWLDLQLGDMDLAALARDVAQRFAPDAAAAGCPISLHLDTTLDGFWDAPRLDQIVTNLVGNAIKYGAGAPIEIEGQGEAAIVKLTVRDRGIGIPLADQERIFQRFERATSERQYGGLGIGLWISSELAKVLGGRISVESAPGAGSAFTLELPRRPPAEASGVRRAPVRAI
jgi:signal transduction histidine kinase